MSEREKFDSMGWRFSKREPRVLVRGSGDELDRIELFHFGVDFTFESPDWMSQAVPIQLLAEFLRRNGYTVFATPKEKP